MTGLVVLSKTRLASHSGKVYFECQMSDGSVWKCDINGKKWVKLEPNEKELTNLFKKNALKK